MVVGVSVLAAVGVGASALLHPASKVCNLGWYIATLAVALCGLAVGLSCSKTLGPFRSGESTTSSLGGAGHLKVALDQHAMVSITDAEGRIVSVNNRFCAISKHARQKLIGQDHRMLNSGHHSKEFMQDLWDTIRSGRVWKGEMKNRAGDGSCYWVDATIVPVLGRHHKPVQYISIQVDITGRVQSQLATSRLLERVHLATHGSGIGVWDWDLKNNVLIWDEYACSLYGLTPDGFSGTYEVWQNMVHPDDREQIAGDVRSALAGAHPLDSSFRVVWPDGSVRHLRVRAVVQRDETGQPVRMTGTNWDTTDRTVAEEKLAASLQEKEILLKEVHHRVKNNLQVVSSLLNLQSRHIADPRALAAFRACQHQVKSMALLHEKLYQSGDCSRIDFGTYLRTLMEHLFQSFGSRAAQVHCLIDAPNVTLSLDTAIPCGLIVNELGSNALKYAFPGRARGEVRLQMSLEPDGLYHLSFRDDGVGLPKDLDWRKAGSLGLQLVNQLTRQLRGTIEYHNGCGTEFHIAFQDSVPKQPSPA
jgi:PAS domain S-box-containing protein